ncbi:MAG: STAS domain-containing protein, partial [Acidimicrobiales bacterium]
MTRSSGSDSAAEMTSSSSSLSIDRSAEGLTPVLRLVGELDLSSVEEVRSVIEGVVALYPSDVVFDLAHLTFMD